MTPKFILTAIWVLSMSVSSQHASAYQEAIGTDNWSHQPDTALPLQSHADSHSADGRLIIEPLTGTNPSARTYDSTEPQALANQYVETTSAEPLVQPEALFPSTHPFWFGYSSPVRVSVHGGESYAEPSTFAAIDLLKPIRNWQFKNGSEQVQYLDVRVAADRDSGVAANIGFGRKHYNATRNTIWDVGVWYDVDGTRETLFHQISAGGQLQGRLFSCRGLYYFPFSDTREIAGYTDLTGNVAYQGNILALERFRNEQQAYQGFEADFGFRLPVDRFAEVRAGYYRFQAEDAAEVSGISASATIEALPSLLLGATGSFGDAAEGNTVLFSATYQFSSRNRIERSDIRHRLAEPMQRNRHIVARGTQVYDPVAGLNADGTAINIIHVSTAGNSTGQFESPYATLSQAAADATTTPNSVILAHADSVFDGQSIVLPADTRFLAETTAHTITTTQLGDVTLPRATTGTAAPVIRNSGATTPAITLANNSEVNGFRIESAAGVGLFADSLTGGTTVLNTAIDGAATGIQLSNGSGTTSFTNVAVTNTTGIGIDLLTNSGNIDFSNTSVTTAGSHGVHIQNSAGSTTFDTLNISDTTGNGLFVEAATTTGQVTLNTATTIANAGLSGVQIESGAGSSAFTSSGTLAITNAGEHGIHLLSNEDTTTSTFAGATTIAGTGSDGVRISNQDLLTASTTNDVQFTGDLTISNTTQSGVVVLNNGSNVSIQTLAISDWNQSAILANNSTGTFSVANALALNNINGSAAATIQLENLTSDITFGDVTITDTARLALGAPTVNLVENNSGINEIGFTSLNVTSINGTALFATQSGANQTQLRIDGGNLSSTGATALSLIGTSTEITLQSVSAQNATVGINLQNLGVANAFHDYLRITGVGTTAASGGTITGAQQGIVVNGSQDVSLNYISVDSTVAGVVLSADGTNQPENASITGLTLTDAGGSNNWVGIDVNWGSGAHFDSPNVINNNAITGTGNDQFGIRVVNTQSLPGMNVTLNGNNISLTGTNTTGITLSANGILPAQTTTAGDIDLIGTVNNVIFGATNPFVSTAANGATINGQVLVNGVNLP